MKQVPCPQCGSSSPYRDEDLQIWFTRMASSTDVAPKAFTCLSCEASLRFELSLGLQETTRSGPTRLSNALLKVPGELTLESIFEAPTQKPLAGPSLYHDEVSTMILTDRKSRSFSTAVESVDETALANASTHVFGKQQKTRDKGPLQDLNDTEPKSIALVNDMILAVKALELNPSEEVTRTAFVASLNAWDDWSTHEKLATIAWDNDQIGVLGRLYRVILEHNAEDAHANKGVKMVMAQAMGKLAQERSSRGEVGESRGPSLWKVVLFVSVLIILGVLGVFMFQR